MPLTQDYIIKQIISKTPEVTPVKINKTNELIVLL